MWRDWWKGHCFFHLWQTVWWMYRQSFPIWFRLYHGNFSMIWFQINNIQRIQYINRTSVSILFLILKAQSYIRSVNSLSTMKTFKDECLKTDNCLFVVMDEYGSTGRGTCFGYADCEFGIDNQGSLSVLIPAVYGEFSKKTFTSWKIRYSSNSIVAKIKW